MPRINSPTYRYVRETYVYTSRTVFTQGQYSTTGRCGSNALHQWFPKCTVPRASYKGIRTYCTVMITFKLAHYLN